MEFVVKFTLFILAGAGLTHFVNSASMSERRMVCYFGSWAVYRPGNGKFDVETIDPFICTHLMYGFTGLKNGEIASLDGWNEKCEGYGKGAYERFTKLKELNPKLKTLVAIGGWNEGSSKYSDMARTAGGRKKFIDSVIPFLERFNFDGLDLDWEYPANRGGKPEDKENFILLAKELRQEFDKHGYLLTAAVSAGLPTIQTAYNIPEMAKWFHFINLMAYDFHGAWDQTTGHHAPLYRNPLDKGDFAVFNVNDSVHYWLDHGMPKEKLVLGMGTYGRGVTLDDPNKNGLYAPGGKPIKAGPYTRSKGFWGYNEICDNLKQQGWTVVVDEYYQAPYAYKGRDWIGYDDPDSIKIKSKFACDMGLGGGMVWSLETDDFQGTCHGERFPIIKTIYRTVVGRYPTYSWQPLPPRSTSAEVCEFYRPTWVPQPPKTSTPRPLIVTGKPSEPDELCKGGKPHVPPQPAPTEDENSEETVEQKPTTAKPQETAPQMPEAPQQPETPPSNKPTQPSASPHEICKEEGLQADPKGDCSKFYTCRMGPDGKSWKVYEHLCPSGTAFDPSIKACNHPQLVPGCEKVTVVSHYKSYFS